MQAQWPHHRTGKVVAEVTVQDKIGEMELVTDQGHDLPSLRQDPIQFR